MADTYLNFIGKLIKLIDQNDGTYALATADIGGSGSSGSSGGSVNTELKAKTTITWNGTDTTNSVEISPADGDVLIWINNTADQELTVTLEHEVEANTFAPYADGTGTAISFKVAASTGEGVYGPFQKFPKYLGGRVVLTAGSAPTAAGTTTVQVQEV